MKDLSLHILDVVENSIRAEAKLIEIAVDEDMEQDLLTLEITDDGKGMEPKIERRATDPFFTTKSGRRFGMGLALLAQATRDAEGEFEVSSEAGHGTRVRAVFRCSHPDRKPLGDIAATMETLVAGNPGVDFVYVHNSDGEVTRVDTREAAQP